MPATVLERVSGVRTLALLRARPQSADHVDRLVEAAEQLAGGFEVATITFTDGQYGRKIESLTVQQSTGTEG